MEPFETVEPVQNRFKRTAFKIYVFFRAAGAAVVLGCIEVFGSPRGRRYIAGTALAGALLLLVLRPPVQVVPSGEIGVRLNRLTGGVAVVPEGPTLMVPLVHELRRYPLRDQVYRPLASASATDAAPFQTIEGLSVGVAVTVRYALDPARVGEVAKRLPTNVGNDLIEPVVDGVLHRALSRHTVREIFSDKRIEIQDDIEAELADPPRQGRHHGALSLPGARRPTGAVSRRAGRDAFGGAGHREDALHAAAQGEEGEGVGA
jgi:SPFH domain / Band 7 family